MRSDAMRAKTPFFRLLGIASAVMIGLALAVPGQAQLNLTGRVLGTVKDQAGAVIPNAAITLMNTRTGISRSAVSNAQGDFLFVDAPAGEYRIVASAHGFTKSAQEFVVRAGVSTTVDVSLHVGSMAQTVTVTSQVPLLSTDSATLSSTISSSEISNLPLSGRNPLTLISLSPGIINTVPPPGLAA